MILETADLLLACKLKKRKIKIALCFAVLMQGREKLPITREECRQLPDAVQKHQSEFEHVEVKAACEKKLIKEIDDG